MEIIAEKIKKKNIAGKEENAVSSIFFFSQNFSRTFIIKVVILHSKG